MIARFFWPYLPLAALLGLSFAGVAFVRGPAAWLVAHVLSGLMAALCAWAMGLSRGLSFANLVFWRVPSWWVWHGLYGLVLGGGLVYPLVQLAHSGNVLWCLWAALGLWATVWWQRYFYAAPLLLLSWEPRRSALSTEIRGICVRLHGDLPDALPHAWPAAIVQSLVVLAPPLLSTSVEGIDRLWWTLAYGVIGLPILLALWLGGLWRALYAEATESTAEAENRARTSADSAMGSQMLAAVHAGDLSALQELLVAAGDIEPDLGAELVLGATRHQQLAALELLAAHGISPALAPGALHLALDRSTTEGSALARALVALGAALEVPNELLNRPLHRAARRGDELTVARLLDAGAEIDALSGEHCSALAEAVRGGHRSLIERLLRGRADVNGAGGMPPLHAAAEAPGDEPELLELLVGYGADLHRLDAVGRSALHAAAAARHPLCARWLLEHGLAVDLADRDGRTTLHLAALARSRELLELLVFWQPNVRARDRSGANALDLAYSAGDPGPEVLRLLAAMGCDMRTTPRPPVAPALPEHWTWGATSEPAPLSIDAAVRGDIKALEAGLAAEPVLDTALAQQLLDAACSHNRAGYARALLLRVAVETASLLASRALMASLEVRPLPAEALALLIEFGADIEGTTADVPLLVRLCARGADGVLVSHAEDRGIDALIGSLLQAGANPNAHGADGASALSTALALRSVAAVQALINAGADVRAVDGLGTPPLVQVVEGGRRELVSLVRLLVRAGADPQQPAADGRTAISVALKRNLLDALKFLMQGGSPRSEALAVAVPGGDLIAAAAHGDPRRLEALLKAGTQPIDGVDEHGATALIHAAGRGQMQCVALLLANGADATRLSQQGVCALAAAISGGHAEVVEYLHRHGYTLLVGLPTTPLVLASGTHRPSVVSVLLGLGADPDQADASGLWPLLAVVRAPLEDALAAERCLSLLLEAGAQPGLRDSKGRSALMWLAGAGDAHCEQDALRSALIRLLLRAGAGVCEQDMAGASALHYAAMHGLVQATNLLLKAGAPPRLRDLKGRTAEDLALEYRQSAISQLLSPV